MKPKGTDVKRFILDLLETLILSVILFLVINAVSARVRVDGFSMRPTLEDGEFILVNRLAYKLGVPKRGEIIVFRSPVTPDEDLIKRIIGLPGDEVVIREGRVYINGDVLEEPYIAASPIYSGTWQVVDGYLFVLGDNRNDSSDSHSWGLVPLPNVVGRSILIYWPFAEWGILNHNIITAVVP
ncbi:MAG: signal peptidase I [Chloroflexi bacterium GWB2_49_20]|nr:MAG: signal peptidase I [Chloroflexi bacterium GWB2_49_20]OGN77775.1 MAG: signal peptidase I [Chloroflexi bacterium GWC2_49_37]OGN86565.1 MAG: signal peptidase I [Chloroflexi bacterium GWD2_49_16]